jgi:hypothetical protein
MATTPSDTPDARAVQAATANISANRLSLMWLVIIGTMAVTLLGAALFLWLAWDA